MDKETGKATFAIVQAEDEIAALGMVIGASWAGARAMTSTSGPGISLMGEFTGLGYYAEIPAVIFDIQRVGPSTGLPTRTAQGDILTTALLSHGDTRHPMLLPSSVARVLRHGDRGVRSRRAAADAGVRDERSRPRDEHLDVGSASRIRTGRSIAARCSTKASSRASANGAATRTWMATAFRTARCRARDAPAYFTRGSGHDERGQYSERSDDYQRNMDRLLRKFDTARTLVPQPEIDASDEAQVGIIAYGTTHWAILESRDQLRDEAGAVFVVPASARLSVHGRPWRTSSVATTASTSSSRTATRKWLALLRMDFRQTLRRKMRSVLHYNGLPIDARSVTDSILAQEGLAVARPPPSAGIVGRGRRVGPSRKGKGIRGKRGKR